LWFYWSHISHWAWNKGYPQIQLSASYIDIHLEIDSEGRFRTHLCDKRYYLNHPIVNFPFICTSIPVAPAYRGYISQLIRHSSACVSYHDFPHRGLLITKILLKQWFLVVKLKSSLRTSCGSHHELINCYGYLCHKWPRICSVCRNHNPVLLIRDLSP
jgi:hypothetical protein